MIFILPYHLYTKTYLPISPTQTCFILIISIFVNCSYFFFCNHCFDVDCCSENTNNIYSNMCPSYSLSKVRIQRSIDNWQNDMYSMIQPLYLESAIYSKFSRNYPDVTRMKSLFYFISWFILHSSLPTKTHINWIILNDFQLHWPNASRLQDDDFIEATAQHQPT